MQTVKTKYFDYGQSEIAYLKGADKVLGAAIECLGKVERVIIPDLFAALVYAVIGQLISIKAVHTVWTRMQERLGEITPQNLAEKTADDIQACGITMKKADCIKNISDLVAEGSLNLDQLHTLQDDAVIQKLTSINGIGRWTAEMMLLNSMERPDVVSWGDIAIRRGMCILYGLGDISKIQFNEYKQRYSPYGSVASIFLWKISFNKA
jgi:DNA-3-methyladenine glycosylase II